MADDNRCNLEAHATLARQVTLAVLAGGAGTRMGMPKAFLRVGDEPLLGWMLARWRWPGPTMLVTSPGVCRPSGGERFDRQFTDPVAGAGPLRGVLTALEHAMTDHVVIATCDMPLITRQMLDDLQEHVNAETAGAVFTRPRDDGSAIEPFPMIVKRAALASIEAAYIAGERSPSRIARAFVAVPYDGDERAWVNLNYPADLQQFLASL